MNVSFTERQEQEIKKLVASGEYQNNSEVVREGLRKLLRERRAEELELKAIVERARVLGASDKTPQELLESLRQKHNYVHAK